MSSTDAYHSLDEKAVLGRASLIQDGTAASNVAAHVYKDEFGVISSNEKGERTFLDDEERQPLLRPPQPKIKQHYLSPDGFLALCVMVILFSSVFGALYFDKWSHSLHGPGFGQKHGVPLIDGHNDLLIMLRYAYIDGIYTDKFKKGWEEGGLYGHVDLPRMAEGEYGGAFWSAFIGCPENGTDFSDQNYASTVKATLEQLDLFKRLSILYPEQFTLARDAAHAESNYKDGKLVSPLAIEGLHQIGNSLSTLRLYHELGVRYATLTWNCHNKYSDAALVSVDGETVVAKPLWGGVSKDGEKLILEMNRLGMLVDLSHTSSDTQRDVLGGSPDKWNGSIAAPIFSHSSAYGVCPHPRNVKDEILHLVKARNSVVMVNFSPDFISCKPGNAKSGLPDFVNETSTIDQVVKHITYIGELIGYEHVGIGTDYDGIPTVPRGLEDVSTFPALFDKLRLKGLKEHQIDAIKGGNVLRVWHEADKVAKKLQKEINPVV